MAQSSAEAPAALLEARRQLGGLVQAFARARALVQIERKRRELGKAPQGLAQVVGELLAPRLDLGVADPIDVGMRVAEEDIVLKRRTDEGHWCQDRGNSAAWFLLQVMLTPDVADV